VIKLIAHAAMTSIRHLALVVFAAILTGCAAPPPVKIASRLLGHTVMNEAKDEMNGPDND
jgi:hypothetical protein